jgi:uroporphyrinogen-III synthase
MQKAKLHILSTRPLSQELIAAAAEQNIVLDQISFIETTPVNDPAITNEIKKVAAQPATVLFTSMNAVQAVADAVTKGNEKVSWTIYCIGNTTKKLAEEQFGADSIKGTADYAEQLADVVIKEREKVVTFFCGNIRRDVLPNKLRAAGIQVNEIVVYQTVETPQKISRQYDAVLFYSPSAVDSYFSVNPVSESTHYFAIGTTTASAIQQYTTQNVIVADKPGKEELAQQAIAHFSQQKI